MSAEQILTIIFDKLDTTIKIDKYFRQLREIALKEANGEFISLQVQKRIFDIIDNEDLKKYIEATTDPEMVLRYALDIPDGIIFFTIKYVDNLLFIELKKELLNHITSTIYTKFITLSRVETVEIIKENGFYKDYKCNVYYYDNDFNLVSKASQEELDLTFSQEFKIPMEFVRFFRLNFKKCSLEISRYIASKKMEKNDDSLAYSESFSFLAPFRIEEFADFMNREYSREFSEAYKMLTDNMQIYNHQFREIEENLKEQIGTDGEIIISANIYHNLLSVLLGLLADGISTKGFIIKKSNDIYTLYKVEITNHQVISTNTILNPIEVLDIYYMNNENQNVPGLADFMGITRGRL